MVVATAADSNVDAGVVGDTVLFAVIVKILCPDFKGFEGDFSVFQKLCLYPFIFTPVRVEPVGFDPN